MGIPKSHEISPPPNTSMAMLRPTMYPTASRGHRQIGPEPKDYSTRGDRTRDPVGSQLEPGLGELEECTDQARDRDQMDAFARLPLRP